MKSPLEVTQRMVCNYYVFDRAILEMFNHGLGQHALGLKRLNQLNLLDYLEDWEIEFMHIKIGESPADLYSRATYMGKPLFSLQWMLNLVPQNYEWYFETVFPIIFFPNRFFSKKKDSNFHHPNIESYAAVFKKSS